MADASYDALIIGGGHNALICGCYLAYNGLTVAVFERLEKLGGASYSDELLLPGFVIDPCSVVSRLWSHPVYSDFKLAEKGLDWILPECGRGVAFPDGSSMILYPSHRVIDKTWGRTEYVEGNAEKSFKSIAKVSDKDAETARVLYDKLRTKWQPALTEVTWNPPRPWGEKDAVEALMDDPQSGFEPVWSVMTIEQMAYELWQSTEMQSYFMRRPMTPIGLFPEDVPGALRMAEFVAACLPAFPASFPKGGMQAIPNALQKALTEMGGEVFIGREVDKVLVENGVAREIRLADGTEVEAKKMVISNVDIGQTVLRFLGLDYVSPKTARRIRNILHERGMLFWAHLGLNEPPRYKAEDYEPDFTLLELRYLMPKDPDYMASKYKAECWVYGFPKDLCPAVFEPSRWDQTRAPEGKHMASTEVWVGPRKLFSGYSEEQWPKVKEQFVKEVIKQWQRYAPNMTEENVIGFYVNTVEDLAKRYIHMMEGDWTLGSQIASQVGRFRPIPEFAGYRTPVRNMYLASAASPGGSGVRGVPGYVCYKVIAEDFGLKKVWEEKGRPY